VRASGRAPAWVVSLSVYGAFLALVCLYTLPLALDVGARLRPHTDARFFTWVLGWVATHALDPRALFDGNLFYPHGNVIAYSEPLLVPAVLTFGPLYWVTGNPVLAHNATLILFWALSGWAAYHAAASLTGSRLAGWVAGIAFCLSPFRIGYYGSVNMQLSFPIPLATLAVARFLERGRGRDLAVAVALIWCQAVSVWYFGIFLGLLTAGLTLGFLFLRWRALSLRKLGLAAVAALVLVLALLPVAWPYLETRQELGFERTLADAARRPADLLSYADAGADSRVYRLAHSRRYPGLFPGFTVLVLAGLAVLWLPTPASAGAPASWRWVRRAVGGAALATLAAIGLFLLTGGFRLHLRGLTVRMTELDLALSALLVLGATALLVEGWAAARGGERGPLAPREWVLLLGVLAALFVVLSLGPVMLLGSRPVGKGSLYAALYDLVPVLSAIRIPLRIGAVSGLLLGLLAAFGAAWASARLRGRRLRYGLAAVPVLLLVEYWTVPLQYEVVRWDDPPPVYRWLGAEAGDFAVLEWPAGDEHVDSVYVLWSLHHRKRLIHGVSGFVPELTRQTLAAVPRLPDDDAMTQLRAIHPLRYLIVHLDHLGDAEGRRWREWEATSPPGLALAGRFGESLAFRILQTAERGWVWQRTFASDVVAARPRARLSLALSTDDAEIEPTVEATFNDRPLARLTPTRSRQEVALSLPPPYPKARPNRVVLRQAYRLRVRPSGDPRYRIGSTGRASPVDLVVTSAGREVGRTASILVNGVEVAPNHRGYNVAVVDPESGAVTARDAFDTFRSESEAGRLADFIRAVPEGAIVAAVIKDEGVASLTGEAVAALASLGGAVDPRGSFHASHLLVGVKGASPGSAVEAAGHRRLLRVIGVDRRDRAMEVDEFRLE